MASGGGVRLGDTGARFWEWEINNAINNLGRSHLSSHRRQLVSEMNGLSLTSLCPWLRALKPAQTHKWGKKSFRCTPTTSTLTNTLWKHASTENDEAKRRRRWCAWNVGTRTYKPTRLLTLFSVSLSLSLSLLDSRCVTGISSLQHFIFIPNNI